MSEPTRPTCSSCVHWARFGDEKRGECRAHPKQVAGSYAQFPPMAPGEWCGEHTPGEHGVREKVKPDTVAQAARARAK